MLIFLQLQENRDWDHTVLPNTKRIATGITLFCLTASKVPKKSSLDKPYSKSENAKLFPSRVIENTAKAKKRLGSFVSLSLSFQLWTHFLSLLWILRDIKNLPISVLSRTLRFKVLTMFNIMTSTKPRRTHCWRSCEKNRTKLGQNWEKRSTLFFF